MTRRPFILTALAVAFVAGTFAAGASAQVNVVELSLICVESGPLPALRSDLCLPPPPERSGLPDLLRALP